MRKLEPQLSDDLELLRAVTSLDIHVRHDFWSGGIGSLEDLSFVFGGAGHIYSPGETLSGPMLESAYRWLTDLVLKGAEQRIAYGYIVKDLRVLQKALHNRLKT